MTRHDLDPAVDVDDAPGSWRGGLPPLDLLKALGDDTRYAIYVELVRAGRPCSTAELAAALDLHVNTVRPHLERLRDVGLLDVRAEATGGVGRPQHLYSTTGPVRPAAADDDLVRGLLEAAAVDGLDVEAVTSAGRRQGAAEAATATPGGDCIAALVAAQARHGFAPQLDDGDPVVVAFDHCPYHDLVDEHAALVCGLHRGQVEGFVAACGDPRAVHFRSLADDRPCEAELVS